MTLEKQLRDALRPVDPGADFAAGVQARIAMQESAGPAARPQPRHAGRRWMIPGALAATLLLAFGIAQQVEQHREQQREALAEAQLVQALEFTSSRLDAVQRRIEQQISEK